jgi:hypothetical protein
MFSTELETGSVKAVGTLEFDEMDNAIVLITVMGKTLTEVELSSKEFEVIRRYFAQDNA